MRHARPGRDWNRHPLAIEPDAAAVEGRDEVESRVEQACALQEEGAPLGEEDREAAEVDHLPVHLRLSEIHVVGQVKQL